MTKVTNKTEQMEAKDPMFVDRAWLMKNLCVSYSTVRKLETLADFPHPVDFLTQRKRYALTDVRAWLAKHTGVDANSGTSETAKA